MSNKRRINYVGWLGHENLGDEALFKAAQDLFSSHQLIPVNTEWEDHSLISPVTLVGGSTGVPEWFEWLRPTKYNYIFGAGVKDPSFYGYDYIFRERLKVAVMLDRLRLFRRIGVRGNISKALLAKHGIASEVIGDPVLSLKPTNLNKDEARIAVCIGSDGILWGMDEGRLFREIAKVCQRLKKEGYEPVLIPFWRENVAVVEKMALKEKIDFFDKWFDVNSTLNFIASCKILIGQKLHSLAFSAAAGTPFICLEYQPKCYDFAQSVGFEKYTIRTDRATEGRITQLFTDLLKNYEEMQRELAGRVETYREKQRNFVFRICRDIEMSPDILWHCPPIQRRIKKILWNADIKLRRKTTLWYAWNRLFFLRMMQNCI